MPNQFQNINGENVELTDAEEAARVAEEKVWTDGRADYIANRKYKDDRADAYALIGDQLDQLFHDMAADKGDKSGEWYKAVAKVKSENPKPE